MYAPHRLVPLPRMSCASLAFRLSWYLASTGRSDRSVGTECSGEGDEGRWLTWAVQVAGSR